MNKSHAAHMENLRKKFPYDLDLLIATGSVPYRSMEQKVSEMVREIFAYEEAYGAEVEAIHSVLDYVQFKSKLNRLLCVYSIYTSFKFLMLLFSIRSLVKS